MSGRSNMSVANPQRERDWPRVGPVCRLGLATRGNTSLDPEDVERAIDRGINYLNWCRHADGLQEWIRQCADRRSDVRVAVQFFARSADEARTELTVCLNDLGTDYLDVVTYYYVESEPEWQQITSPGGAAEVIEAAREDGVIRAVGLTTHQRRLAAKWARGGRLDSLMIRYNAAHRGAEQDIFSATEDLALPLVAFTCLRWGELMRPTPADPAGFVPPRAVDCYRWVLCQPAVTVALAAPDGGGELDELLTLLDPWQGMPDVDYQALSDHGDRVYRHAGHFP